jgi:uncharacterized lipoprotein YddW (UPF0748 family)
MYCGALFAAGLVLLPAPAADPAAPPAVPREFRAAWVATVANIDWPSRKGLTAEQQQEEMRAILDKAVELRLNAIILQVRPMADALYDSKLEPWSEFLSGTAGKPPQPNYDPLTFAVREAHARGLELHAWLNPYRARVPAAHSPVPDDHLVKRRPDLAKPYGKHHWLNPTHPEVQDHSLRVFLDVVRRYDIDGIHMDDYFYPYPEMGADGKEIPFPDDDTWAAYQKSDGVFGRDDWRRYAVNRFVVRLYKETKAAKPWVKVGISPFGIWRPGHPEGIKGFDQYGKLYADAKLWLNRGWVDYFTPQLYWPIDKPEQSYPKLLTWWVSQNTERRHVWPGQNASRWPAQEIVAQIRVTRAQTGATGNVLFSMKALMNNKGGVADALKAVYAEPALVPASPWLGDKPPARPWVRWATESGRGSLLIRPPDEHVRLKDILNPPRLYVVRSLAGGKWSIKIFPADGRNLVTVPFPAAPEQIVVTAIDRVGNESEQAVAATEN